MLSLARVSPNSHDHRLRPRTEGMPSAAPDSQLEPVSTPLTKPARLPPYERMKWIENNDMRNFEDLRGTPRTLSH